METAIVILLAVIAYILWKSLKLKEQEREEHLAAEWDREQKNKAEATRQKYPYITGKANPNWIELFGERINDSSRERLLKMAWLLYMGELKNVPHEGELIVSEIDYDNLWCLTEELYEHLEKYHQGNKIEKMIALAAYWQEAATKVGEIFEINPKFTNTEFDKPPFTDLEKIVHWFPKNTDHPVEEFSCRESKTGKFPRGSSGSEYTHEEMKRQGV